MPNNDVVFLGEDHPAPKPSSNRYKNNLGILSTESGIVFLYTVMLAVWSFGTSDLLKVGGTIYNL